MPRFLVLEVRQITAKTLEAARDQALADAGKRVHVQVGESLEQLTHPAHLADAQAMFAPSGKATDG